MGNKTSSLEIMVMEFSFWRDKKVLITGHTGFKGGWLSIWLHQLGAKVIGFSNDIPSEPSLFKLAKIEKIVKSIKGDICDYDTVCEILAYYKPEIIFHMAAQALVRLSYDFPIKTYSTNVMGTLHVLEAGRLIPSVKAIIIVTSDKCYQNTQNRENNKGYKENDILGGYDPYSNSKACAELISSAYRSSYYNNLNSCGLATVRAGNVIGGGDWAKDRLIPDLMRCILNGNEFTVRYPDAIRPWQHVLEPLYGYMLLAQKLYKNPMDFSEAWNFGPNDRDVKPVNWVIDKIKELWGNESIAIKYQKDYKLHESSILKLNNSKAKSHLKWTPVWNLEDALNKTVEWYRSYKAGDNIFDETISQINEYCSIIS